MIKEDFDRYTAIIICNKQEKRSRLKSFLRESMIFNVISHSNLDDFVDKNYQNFTYDYIFYSDDLPHASLAELKLKIKNDKKNVYTKNLIVFSDKRELPRESLVKSLLAGANGILLSPYSIYNLMEACNIPDKKKSNRTSNSRLNIAVNMLIKESIESSSTPSMVHKIPFEVKELFKNEQINSLSKSLVKHLSNVNHVSRIASFSNLHDKVSKFIKGKI